MNLLTKENIRKLPKSKRVIAKSLSKVLGDCDSVTGAEFNFWCPFCEREQGHLHINFIKNKALCHKCGYGAKNLLKIFLDLGIEEPELYTSTPVGDLRSVLTELWDKKDSEDRGVEKMELPAGYKVLKTQGKEIFNKIFLGYLREFRGMSDDEINSVPMGYTMTGRFRGRLIFPCYMHGKMVYFTSRAVLTGEPKSLHPGGTERRYVLYGLDWLLDTDHLFLVEGVMDTMAFRNRSLALLGHFVSNEQARILRGINPKEITICFDPDVPRDRVRYACKLLSRQVESTVSFMELDHGDPYDLRNVIDRYIRRRIIYNKHHSIRNAIEEAFENGIRKRKEMRSKI